MFRAKDKTGEEFFGWLVDVSAFDAHKPAWRIVSQLTNGIVYHPIDPTTLAMQTGILDKHKVEIYGSYSVDGIKSEGGDWVRIMCDESPIEFQINWLKENQWCGWEIGSQDEIEIIGEKK